MTGVSEDLVQGRRFHLIEVVGAGAFGEVYLAEQDSGAGFRRKVALKLLHADVEKIQDAGRRMRDEARILGRLSHRHIVTVLDLVKLGSRWAVVMDYVPGADLEEVVKTLHTTESACPPGPALEIGAAILRALDAAYRAEDDQGLPLKVVHRDIKPSNVRLTSDGEVKVLDFGVARVELGTREAQTKAEGWMGTERYMSPERILCEGDTPAGDVYAALASVAEALLLEPLGRTPVLPERHDPFLEQRLVVIRDRLIADAPWGRLTEEQAHEVVSLLRQGLACDPEERPPAAELAERLEALSRRLPGPSLSAFAREVVPRVPEALGHQRKPASGVLSEAAGITGVGVSRLPSRPPTSGDATLMPVAPEGSAAPPPRRWPWMVAAAVLAATLTVAVGVAVLGGFAAAFTIGAGSAATVPPAPDPAPPPAPTAAPVPEPVVQPAPEPVVEPPEPVVEPAAEPVAAPVPAPVPAAPAPAPAQPKPAAPVPAPVAVDAPRLAKALVTVADAASVNVTCGDRTAVGTASARITDFPSGPCQVTAVYLGRTYTTSVRVERERTVACTVSGDALSCP